MAIWIWELPGGTLREVSVAAMGVGWGEGGVDQGEVKVVGGEGW